MKCCLVNPFSTKEYLGNRFFDGPYGLLKDYFAEHGYSIDTYDRGDLKTADLVLSFNYDPIFYSECMASGLTPEKMVLIAFEPRVVIPEQYSKKMTDMFGKVLTFDLTRVNGKNVFHFRYPQGQKVAESVAGYDDRRGLVLINANKYSYEDGELYSYRRKAIRYFEKFADMFSLYGFGWDRGIEAVPLDRKTPARFARSLIERFEAIRPYKTYKGTTADKYKTLSKFRYSLCFENEIDTLGYLTEKVFDCLVAGVIPVYLGAKNVSEYIPREAYIDMREFNNFGDLKRFLDEQSEDDFNRMQIAGQKYLRSEDFTSRTPEHVFRDMTEVILG